MHGKCRTSSRNERAGKVHRHRAGPPRQPDTEADTANDNDTINDRLAHLIETCDGSPTFKAELGAFAEQLSDKVGNVTVDDIKDLLEVFERSCSTMTAQECAVRLRAFLDDVSENIAASPQENEYTIRYTCTLKGLRYFLAEREFWNDWQLEEDERQGGALDDRWEVPIPAFDRLSHAKQAAANIESVCSTALQDPDIPETTRGLFRTIEGQITALDVALDGCEVELRKSD